MSWLPAAADADIVELARSVDAVVEPYVEAGDFMGVVAIQRDGEPALVRSYGHAVVELEVPQSASNVFMIGSISKQFTAVALLLLEQEGVLEVEDAVSRGAGEGAPAGIRG